jgi:hypothetical protein
LFQVLDLLCVLLSRPQLIQLEVLEVKGLQHECSNGNHHLPEFGSGYVRLLMGRMSILKVSDGYAGMRKMRYANILNCDWHLLAGPFHCIETKHVHFLYAWLTKLSQVILSHFRNKSSKSHRNIRSHQCPSTLHDHSTNYTLDIVRRFAEVLGVPSLYIFLLETSWNWIAGASESQWNSLVWKITCTDWLQKTNWKCWK